ncbi:MAG: ATPase domain-containing protein [Candidatus Micrarchaeia archaeon]
MFAKKKQDTRIVRVSTGFPRLDSMLQGGLPQKTITLLSGACGTGKSTFAMQFLYQGARYSDEPGVYVTLEESPQSLVNNMSLFGWDLDELIEKKKMMVIKPEIYKFDSLKQIIADSIEKIGAKRLVVDSYSVLLTYFSDPNQIRHGLVQLDREIKKMGCTAIVISDIKDNAEIFSTTGIEEFIVDGVIVLSLIKDEKRPHMSRRAISVRKMRATKHPLGMYGFDIGDRGISIGDGMGRGGGPGPVPGNGAGEHAAKKVKAKKNKIKAQPKDQSTMNLSAFRSKGHHSWKWKHL